MRSWLPSFLGTTALAAGLALGAGAALAGPTVDAIKARGKIKCGIPTPSAGFAFPDSKGVVRGFDADFCRAVAAAVLGDGEKVDFVPTTSQARFQALQPGEVDLLSRQTTWTFGRDNALAFNFAPPCSMTARASWCRRSWASPAPSSSTGPRSASNPAPRPNSTSPTSSAPTT